MYIYIGVTIQSPQLDINTVAAGGGSRLFFRNGLFIVGPESAGVLKYTRYSISKHHQC
jgi:N-methylhydantoinase A/oxoprolinase/acetone carboxylase beta subunit